jgi:hypothetical protein
VKKDVLRYVVFQEEQAQRHSTHIAALLTALVLSRWRLGTTTLSSSEFSCLASHTKRCSSRSEVNHERRRSHLWQEYTKEIPTLALPYLLYPKQHSALQDYARHTGLSSRSKNCTKFNFSISLALATFLDYPVLFVPLSPPFNRFMILVPALPSLFIMYRPPSCFPSSLFPSR